MHVLPDLILAPEIDETLAAGELPRAYALRMAVQKAEAVAARMAVGAWVLAADTVVACGRRVLPKAETREQARDCLELLAGRRHRVHGGVVVLAPDGRRSAKVVLTMVEMLRLSGDARTRYLDSGEWQGKAGGYAIQGAAAAFIPAISGSYTNVVGLPLTETVQMLEGLGWRSPSAARSKSEHLNGAVSGASK